MKIYEKPMIVVEKINVEDVITSSVLGVYDNNSDTNTVNQSAGTTKTIIFEW